MKQLKNHSISDYCKALSAKIPTPGGGSAAACTAAMGVSLLIMVARYSLGKSQNKRVEARLQKIVDQCEVLKKDLLALVDKDAQAYLAVRKAAQKGSAKEKAAAQRNACAVQKKVGKFCYKAIQMAPTLVKDGNKYLIADVEVAAELLMAAFNSGLVLSK